MRVLVDYRAALRERSGVGEYTHEVLRALRALPAGSGAEAIELTAFSASRRDRLTAGPDLDGVRVVDRRIPVRVLNFAWHRLGWPPAELLTGQQFDVVHSMHPLLLPEIGRAHV